MVHMDNPIWNDAQQDQWDFFNIVEESAVDEYVEQTGDSSGRAMTTVTFEEPIMVMDMLYHGLVLAFEESVANGDFQHAAFAHRLLKRMFEQEPSYDPLNPTRRTETPQEAQQRQMEEMFGMGSMGGMGGGLGASMSTDDTSHWGAEEENAESDSEDDEDEEGGKTPVDEFIEEYGEQALDAVELAMQMNPGSVPGAEDGSESAIRWIAGAASGLIDGSVPLTDLNEVVEELAQDAEMDPGGEGTFDPEEALSDAEQELPDYEDIISLRETYPVSDLQARNLWHAGFKTPEDVEDSAQSELADVEDIGPALAARIMAVHDGQDADGK